MSSLIIAARYSLYKYPCPTIINKLTMKFTTLIAIASATQAVQISEATPLNSLAQVEASTEVEAEGCGYGGYGRGYGGYLGCGGYGGYRCYYPRYGGSCYKSCYKPYYRSCGYKSCGCGCGCAGSCGCC